MNHPRLSFLYAKMALDIPFPKDDILFISEDVYKYGILDEIASTAFYAGKAHMGYAACKKLLLESLLPEEHKERVQTNLQQYLKFFEHTNQMESIRQMDEQAAKQSEKKDHKPALFPAQKKKFKSRKTVHR